MLSVDQFVIAILSRDGATGVVADPPAGALLSADGAGGASWNAPAPADLTLYVSLTGSDSNNGATPTTALRTIEAAMASVRRQGWTASASIRLLPGTHDLIGGGIFRTDVAPGARESLLVIEGDSLAPLGTFAVQSVVAVGFLLDVTIASAVPLAADGERVRFTSGPLSGQSFIVGNVNGSTFTVMTTDNIAPGPGDTFVLEAVTAAINITDSITFTGGLFLMRDLQLIIPPVLALTDDTLILSGVHITAPLSGAFITLTNGTLASGSGVFANIAGPNPIGFSMTGSGAGIISKFGGSMQVQNSYFRDVTLIVHNCNAEILQVLYQGCVLFVIVGSYWDSFESRYLDCQASPGALNFIDSASTLANIDVSNCPVYGIYVESSRLHINGAVTSVIPNGLVGVFINEQGSVAASFTTPSITGSSGDAIVGQNAVATWANLVSGVAPRSDFATPAPVFASIGFQI
jgi:hypothetical protein